MENLKPKSETKSNIEQLAEDLGKRVLSATELSEFSADFREKQRNSAVEEARYFAGEIYDIQMSFGGRLDKLSTENSKMTREEFEKWEDDFSDNWHRTRRIVQENNMTSDQEAEAEEPMIAYTTDTLLHRTIEAQAGNWYHERQAALKQAISASDTPAEQKEQELQFLSGFYGAVSEHLDYKYMSQSDIADYGAQRYETDRTAAHNDAIDYLNNLNDLAIKYGTRPFTPRNFWNSRNKSQTIPMQKKMRYDRDIIEEYYAIAFSSDVRKREAKQQHDLRFGLY